MRIIAGMHRSRKLNTLAGNNTRPTQDKIKEAMFSSLGGSFYEGKMLDLFAGSGSVGLESISRGIKEAYFCDSNKEAMKVISSNIALLKEEKKCHVMNCDYQSALSQCSRQKFSFIFIDPPYALKVIDECLEYIDTHDMLDAYGSVVVESEKTDSFAECYGKLVKYKEKTYGITRLTYYRKEEE